MNAKNVVILGGGFAGVQAAFAVRRYNGKAAITLIDRTGNATMLPALPDALSGRIPRENLYRPLPDILGDVARIVIARVERVDPAKRMVITDRGIFPYDGLVIATGSQQSPLPAPLTGVEWHAVNTLEKALAFRRTVEERLTAAPSLSVLVVGAGYTGLETAVSLRQGIAQAGTAAEITVVDVAEDILPMVSDDERRRIREYLTRMDISLRLGSRVTEVTARDSGTSGEATAQGSARRYGARQFEVHLSDGTVIVDPVVCWAGGMVGTAADFGLEVDFSRDGRIVTNEFLQVPNHPDIFAAGDAAAIRRPDGTAVRRAVNFSYYSGRRAGKNVAAWLSDRPMKPFRPVDLGWIIPLGGESVGRVFGVFKVGRRLGLRLHYIMSGFRHFGGGKGLAYYARAFVPTGRSDPLVPAAAPRPTPRPGLRPSSRPEDQ